jgi:chromosome partitioning protein
MCPAANCLLHAFPLQRAIRATTVGNLDLVTGSVELASADLSLADVPGRELTLKHVLQRVGQRSDFVILDCPPNLSLVTINALVAADALIVPVTPQHLAVEGLVSFLASADKVRGRLASRGRLLGMLLTMVVPGSSPGLELRERLRAQYRDEVFYTEILASRALEEAPAFGKTIFQHAPRSRAAASFKRLAGEMLERLRRTRR